MRSRRADTCLRVARQAIVEGRLADAEQRLQEACEIDPEATEPRLLLEELRSPSNGSEAGTNAPTRRGAGWSHWLAAAVAILVLAALAFFWPETKHPKQESPARREPSTPAVDLPVSVEAVPVEAAPLPSDRPSDFGAARTPPPVGTAGSGSAGPDAVDARREPPIETAPVRAAPPPAELSTPAPASTAVTAMAAVRTADPGGTAPRTASGVPENLPGGIRLSSDTQLQPLPQPMAPMASPAAASGGHAEPDPAPASLRKPPSPTDQELIGATLGRYADAYAKLDARAAQQVWPTVDAGALQRAFGGLEAQRVVFEHCDLEISGAVARAACRGQARYVPKVGSREPLTESRTWIFTLLKDQSDWKIKSAEVR